MRAVSQLMREYFSGFDNKPSVILGGQFSAKADDTPIVPKKKSDWELLQDPERLSRTFRFDNRWIVRKFVSELLDFEARTRRCSSITIDENDVTVECWTRGPNCVTEIDKELAREADAIFHEVKE